MVSPQGQRSPTDEPEALAENLRRAGYAVYGPSHEGIYETSTEICHGGDSPRGLFFGPGPNGRGVAGSCRTRDCGQGAGHAGFLTALYAKAGLQPPSPPQRERLVHVADYDYRGPDGALRYQVRRYLDTRKPAGKDKVFPQRRPDPDHPGQWIEGKGAMSGVDRILYRLPELRAADPEAWVWIVEGEKDVDRLTDLGLVATCNPEGAGKWTKRRATLFNAELEGRRCVLVRDNDDAGAKHVAQVAVELCGKAKELRIIEEIPSVGEGGDASDYLDLGHSVDDLLQLLEAAQHWTPPEVEGWEEEAPAESDDTPHEVRRAERLGRPPWYSLGVEYGNELKGQYVYVQDHREQTWWCYLDNVWRPLPSSDGRIRSRFASNRYGFAISLLKAGKRDLAIVATRDKDWDSNRSKSSDFWVGLEQTLAGTEPQPEVHHLGTPSGVVDLKTGRLLDHDPALGIRALTRGRYLPDRVVEHWQVLHRRFANVFETGVIQDMIALCGLAMTGLAQSHRAIVMVVGPPGSGKGGAVNTVVRSLGGRAMGVRSDWVERRGANEIDSTTAEALEAQPAIIAIGELGGDTSLTHRRVLSLTGNEPLSARRPHGPNIYGTLQAQVWSTAVEPPAFPRGTGIERRLAVLPTLRSLEDSERNEEDGWSQELFDAVVTLAALQARYVYSQGYQPPAGHQEAREAVLRDMDPLAAWLEELPDTFHGIAVSEVLSRAREEMGMEKLTSTKLGRKIVASSRWVRGRDRRADAPHNNRCVYLKDSPEANLV